MTRFKIVIGANFGDEGKGLMADHFAAEASEQNRSCLGVCSNGGAQRGHTVVTPEGRRHVFHHFASGTMAGADTWLPGYFILNPIMFMDEYEELQVYGPRVFLSQDCPVTTPFDMITNQIIEQHRGTARHGSCGVGIWETLVRDGARLKEMMDMTDDELRRYLLDCKEYMKMRLGTLGIEEIPEGWRDIVDDMRLIENYIADFRSMLRLSTLAEADIMAEYDTVVFEAGQGLLLDRNRKEYGCNTTPSNTGLRNPAELIREYLHSEKGSHIFGINSEVDIEVCYVTRTYLTRHGAGRFDQECPKAEINPAMVDLTNVPNPYQGTIRYGKLDEKALIRRIREDFDSERFPYGIKARRTLAVTHTNEYYTTLENEADYLFCGETRLGRAESADNWQDYRVDA